MEPEHRLVEFLCAVCGTQGLTVSEKPTQRIGVDLHCPTCGHPLHILLGVHQHPEPIAV